MFQNYVVSTRLDAQLFYVTIFENHLQCLLASVLSLSLL